MHNHIYNDCLFHKDEGEMRLLKLFFSSATRFPMLRGQICYKRRLRTG